MKTKTILNTSGALITIGGIAAGSYYGLNSKFSTNTSLNNGTEQGNSKSRPRKSISAWLQSKGDKVILSKHDTNKQNAWNDKWNKFKEWYDQNSNNANWQIYDWNTNKGNGEGYKKFQELCKTNSEKETDDQDQLLKEVIEHCVEESN